MPMLTYDTIETVGIYVNQNGQRVGTIKRSKDNMWRFLPELNCPFGQAIHRHGSMIELQKTLEAVAAYAARLKNASEAKDPDRYDQFKEED